MDQFRRQQNDRRLLVTFSEYQSMMNAARCSQSEWSLPDSFFVDGTTVNQNNPNRTVPMHEDEEERNERFGDKHNSGMLRQEIDIA
jgi:hypothetical protein